MNKEIVTFGDIEVENLILINDLDIGKNLSI